jgi:hypothetical protein
VWNEVERRAAPAPVDLIELLKRWGGDAPERDYNVSHALVPIVQADLAWPSYSGQSSVAHKSTKSLCDARATHLRYPRLVVRYWTIHKY